jgi:hypothetical protein
MGHQLRLRAEPGARPSPRERAMVPADPPASGGAGAAGLCWLWGLVELHLAQAEPDSAA